VCVCACVWVRLRVLPLALCLWHSRFSTGTLLAVHLVLHHTACGAPGSLLQCLWHSWSFTTLHAAMESVHKLLLNLHCLQPVPGAPNCDGSFALCALICLWRCASAASARSLKRAWQKKRQCGASQPTSRCGTGIRQENACNVCCWHSREG